MVEAEAVVVLSPPLIAERTVFNAADTADAASSLASFADSFASCAAAMVASFVVSFSSLSTCSTTVWVTAPDKI